MSEFLKYVLWLLLKCSGNQKNIGCHFHTYIVRMAYDVRLFQTSMEEGKNILISPLSVLYALSMTANGADGEIGYGRCL